jgi:hypothetical protein
MPKFLIDLLYEVPVNLVRIGSVGLEHPVVILADDLRSVQLLIDRLDDPSRTSR